MDGWTDHCDTLSRNFDHILLTLCSVSLSRRLPLLVSQCSFFPLFLNMFCSGGTALSFCYLPLKHIGYWDQLASPRERTVRPGSKTKEKIQLRWHQVIPPQSSLVQATSNLKASAVIPNVGFVMECWLVVTPPALTE